MDEREMVYWAWFISSKLLIGGLCILGITFVLCLCFIMCYPAYDIFFKRKKSTAWTQSTKWLGSVSPEKLADLIEKYNNFLKTARSSPDELTEEVKRLLSASELVPKLCNLALEHKLPENERVATSVLKTESEPLRYALSLIRRESAQPSFS